MASGLNSTFRLLGVATGIAALGAAFESRVVNSFSKLAPQASEGSGEVVAASGIAPVAESESLQVQEATVVAAERAFLGGLNEIVLIAALVAFIGAALATVLVRDRDLVSAREGAGIAKLDDAGEVPAFGVPEPEAARPATV